MNQDEKKEQQAEYIVKMENIQLAFDIAKIPAPSEEQEKVMFETLEKLSRPYDEAAIIRKAQEEERERIIKKAETVVNTIRRETIYELLKSFGYNCVGQQETCICNVCNAARYCAEIRDKKKFRDSKQE